MRQLRQLARLHGVETSYRDGSSRNRRASRETLLGALQGLGVEDELLRDIPRALEERRYECWRRPVEPVVVAWNGAAVKTELRLPETENKSRRLEGWLRLESGEKKRVRYRLAELPVTATAEVKGTRFLLRSLPLPGGLPAGYHSLCLDVGRRRVETLIISAPRSSFSPSADGIKRRWGAFLPLHALRVRGGRGTGDLSDLETLVRWLGGLGGTVVGTLPLLPAFLDQPFDPSPYSPVSRRFWNEFYIDLTRVPELTKCPGALRLWRSAAVQRELRRERARKLVDYHGQMALKRKVLEKMARGFFAGPSRRSAAFRAFLVEHPGVKAYARFRATLERQRVPWQKWPARLRHGSLRPGDCDREVERYHLFSQWLVHEQMDRVTRVAGERGMGLYLDLPLGVHSDGFDVWQEQDQFVLQCQTGAPPDDFFTRGQDWGFPPPHPERIRQTGHAYFIDCLRHHLRQARFLRIDHVMGLHRLFWIPRGLTPAEGVYVRYPAEEFYAILSLESHRHRSTIVGENLGTVPPPVNPAMSRHRIQKLFVLQYELEPRTTRPLPRPPRESLASLNTHDMPTFAAFWKGLDIKDCHARGLWDRAGTQRERKRRRELKKMLLRYYQKAGLVPRRADGVIRALLEASLSYLARSSAQTQIVNLEDLWLETRPQNVPGTGLERPNWRRKARVTFEWLCNDARAVDILKEIDRLRRGETRRS